MAYIDSHTGELVIRVVYDGAPNAGKTTNVRQLHEGLLATRPGTLESPGARGRQTEWFDWRDFFGGYLEGVPLRCEVLTVPGQTQLAGRRARVLSEADCVVLVLDAARPESHAPSLEALAATGAPLERLVLQLNKADLGPARDLHSIRAALGLPRSVPILAACAERGEGVDTTFLTAVRLASAVARRALRDATLPTRERARGAVALHAELREHERPPLPAPDGAWHLIGEATHAATARRVLTHAQPSVALRTWAPPDAQQWEGVGHAVHFRPEWCFETLDAARRSLQALVAPHRFVLVDAHSRAFLVTRDAPTLLDEVEGFLAGDAVPAAVARLTEAWDALHEERSRAVVCISTAAAVDGTWVHLGFGTPRFPSTVSGWTRALYEAVLEREIWPELWGLAPSPTSPPSVDDGPPRRARHGRITT